MAKDLNKKINLSITPESIENLKSARKEIRSLEQMMQNISKLKFPGFGGGSGGGGGGGGGKGSKPAANEDAMALAAARKELGLAKTEAILYGRERDNLRAKYESEGRSIKQVNALLDRHAQTSRAALSSAEALANAKNYLNKINDLNIKGSVDYRNALAAVAGQELLLRNRMIDATPMRRISVGIGEVTRSLSMLSPQFGMVAMQFEAVKRLLTAGFGLEPGGFLKGNIAQSSDAGIKKAREELASKMTKGTTDIDATSGAMAKLRIMSQGAAEGMAGLGRAVMGVVASIPMLAGLIGVLGGITIGMRAIKKGAEFEDMEYQMAALINATVQFKREGEKNFVSPAENLEHSLENAKELVSTFAKDAPRLAGVTLQDLAETASVTLGSIGTMGITDPKQQARLIESMAVAIKVVTKGQQNAGLQLASESNALLRGQFNQNNRLINILASKVGGKEVFKKQLDEAKKAGKLGEFLTEQLKPFIDSANFAAGTMTNLQSIFVDFLTNTQKAMAESGLLQSAKNFFKTFMEGFIEMNNPETFGSMKQEWTDFSTSLGDSLTKLFDALRPFAKVASDTLWGLAKGFKLAVDWITPFVAWLSSLTAAAVAVVEWLGKIGKGFVDFSNGLLKTKSSADAFMAILFVFIAMFNPFIGIIGATISILKILDDTFPELTSGVLGMATNWGKAWDFIKIQTKVAIDDMLGAIDSLLDALGGINSWSYTVKGLSQSIKKARFELTGGPAIPPEQQNAIGKIFGAGKLPKQSVVPIRDQARSLWGQFVDAGKEEREKLDLKKALGFGRAGKPGPEEDKGAASRAAQLADAQELVRAKAIEAKLAKELLEIENQKAKIKNKELDIQKKLNDAALAKQRKDAELDRGKASIESKRQDIELLYTQQKISEGQKSQMESQLKAQENQIEYQKTQNDLAYKRAEIEAQIEKNYGAQQERLEDIKAARAEMKAIDEKIASKGQQLLDPAAAGKNGEQFRERMKGEIETLEKERTNALQKINKLLQDNTRLTKEEAENVRKTTEETTIQAKTYEDEKNEREERRLKEEQQAQAELQEKFKTQSRDLRKSVLSAGKEIATNIMQALEDGSIDLAEAFGIFETVVSKLSDIFEKLAQLGQLVGGVQTGEGGSPMNIFKGILGIGKGGPAGMKQSYTMQAGDMLQKNAEGVFGVYNQAGNLIKDLGTKCGIQAKQAVGQATGGAGGILDTLFGGAAGGGMGAMSAMLSGGLIIAQVGSMVFGFLKSMKEKKIQKQINKYKEVVKQQEKKIEQADNDLYRSGLDKMNNEIKTRQQAIQEITAAYNRMGKKAKRRVGEDFQNTIEKLNRSIEELQIEMGKEFLGFKQKVKISGIKDKDLRSLGESLSSVFDEAFKYVAGGFDPTEVQTLLNNELGDLREDFFKTLDDEIANNLQQRNELTQQALEDTKSRLESLADNLRTALEEGGFVAAKTTDQKIRDAIKAYRTEASSAAEDSAKQLADLAKQEAELRAQRAAGVDFYSSQVSASMALLAQYAAAGSVEAYERNLGMALSNISVTPQTTQYFVNAVQVAMNQNLQDIANALPR